MRLVIATPFLETKGGMERVVLKIAQQFKAKIHCYSYDAEGTFPEFKALDIETAKPGNFSKLPLGKRISTAMDAGSHFYNVKLKDYDLINAHQTPSEWIRNKNSPVLWYCYSPNREAFDLYQWRMKKRSIPSKLAFWSSIQAFKLLEYQTVPKIEYIFTSCKNPQERIKRYLKRESEVLYPGVDAQKFSCKGYERFFFYPSRIVPEKELEYAIEAFKLFANRQNPKPGTADTKPGMRWSFVIAGALSQRPEHQAYYKKLQSLCTKDITIETNVSDERLLDLYSRCYATLFTPVNEDYGLIPLESMASSKPCIGRNEGGLKETIENNRDGFLVNSIWEMAERMEQLSKDEERCRNMGRAGRSKVERDFTWERFLSRFEEKAEEMVRAKAEGPK
jgi:glycosyltransferase involved in cell wall biosynthesis